MKPILIVLIFVLAASMIFIPALFVTLFDQDESSNKNLQEKVELKLDPGKNIPVHVYRNASHKIETYPLEVYVQGVIAAEMPIDFELEALKAQAIAARTYIVKKIIDKSFNDVPEGAMVTDTVKHQVFISNEELKKLWGFQYNERISKLNRVINETGGQVITYQGRPIDALFFSTSNGYTENSEDYWQKAVPYLKSVASPWDVTSPKYQTTTSVPFTVIQSKLDIDPVVYASSGQEWIKILETTAGQRVKKIKIGDNLLSGRQIRELFDLSSSSFTWEISEDSIIFHNKGYGHGVGMSQYGANGMAKEGKTAKEIITYYYTGVEITNIADWIKPM